VLREEEWRGGGARKFDAVLRKERRDGKIGETRSIPEGQFERSRRWGGELDRIDRRNQVQLSPVVGGVNGCTTKRCSEM
jgi:hypothetical protein